MQVGCSGSLNCCVAIVVVMKLGEVYLMLVAVHGVDIGSIVI